MTESKWLGVNGEAIYASLLWIYANATHRNVYGISVYLVRSNSARPGVRKVKGAVAVAARTGLFWAIIVFGCVRSTDPILNQNLLFNV